MSPLDRLRAAALAYPETLEDHPWGETAIKVGGKVFLFLGAREAGGLAFSVKLPKSAMSVLEEPFASPTHYGLGRHGWVTCAFDHDEDVPMEEALRWLDESFRAVAPKRVSAKLDATPPKKPRRRP